MASLVEQAKALQAVLGDLSTVTVEKIVALFRQYGDSVDFRQILEAAYPELVQQYTGLAAMVTTQWYRELDPQSGFVPASAATAVPAEQFTKTIGWALYAPGSADPTERLAGSAKRMVFNASRDTVKTNLEAEFGPEWRTRWARYASANACPFCRILATRGAVYTSEQSATSVGGRGKDVSTNFTADGRRKRGGQAKGVRARGNQAIDSKYHDHCRCIAVAVRGGTDYHPPSYVEQWEQDYVNAVKAAAAAGETKGEFGAIDLNAVLRRMK